jgi:hypothetical protein
MASSFASVSASMKKSTSPVASRAPALRTAEIFRRSARSTCAPSSPAILGARAMEYSYWELKNHAKFRTPRG